MTRRTARRLATDTRGTTTVEYILSVCLMVVVCFGAYRGLGETVASRVAGATRVIADEDGSGGSSSGGASGSGSRALAHPGGEGAGAGAGFDPADDPAPEGTGGGALAAGPGEPSSHASRRRPPATGGGGRAGGGGAGGGGSGRSPIRDAEDRQEARRIVDALTQGDRESTRAVRFTMSQMPLSDLRTLQSAGVLVAVGNAADYVHPIVANAQIPGTPPGTTIRTANAAIYIPEERIIVVPPDRPEAVLHEAGHALDHARNWESQSPEFTRARDAELARGSLGAYMVQTGSADRRGREETYAQSYHVYRHHKEQGTLDQMRAEHPHLHDYWSKRADD